MGAADYSSPHAAGSHVTSCRCLLVCAWEGWHRKLSVIVTKSRQLPLTKVCVCVGGGGEDVVKGQLF